MGQKINPISLRLHYTNRHFDSCWYSKYFYKNLLTRDLFLHQYFTNFLKLLKLPTGRYSIQHLKKKTQVYNFLCYPKFTREWRSRVFGLKKKQNSLKKFFKIKTQLKKKTKKHTKLNSFYTGLNQLALHKIQKKITSFQNLKLWSTLSVKKSTLMLFLEKNQTTNFEIHWNKLQKTQMSSLQKHKNWNPKNLKNNHSFKILQNPLTNSNLLFLQNLFVYKTLKTNLKVKFLEKKTQNYLVTSKKLKSVCSVSVPNFSNGSKLLNFEIDEKLGPNKHKNLAVTVKSISPCPFKVLNLKYKNYLESCLSRFFQLEMDLISFKIKHDWQNAQYLADEIVYFLERRIPFRRLKGKICSQLIKIPEIRGVRILCSGRVGGKSKKAQRSKTECIKYGQTSLQVFSSKIDFSAKTAFTSFGCVGVKVWICYN